MTEGLVGNWAGKVGGYMNNLKLIPQWAMARIELNLIHFDKATPEDVVEKMKTMTEFELMEEYLSWYGLTNHSARIIDLVHSLDKATGRYNY